MPGLSSSADQPHPDSLDEKTDAPKTNGSKDEKSRNPAGNPVIEQDSATSGEAIPAGQVVLFFVLAAVGGIADLWTKQIIFDWRGLPGQSDIWWLVDDYFGIETAVNIGAVFGLGAGKGLFFAAFSVIAAIGILVWLFKFRAATSLWLTWALGMITGGIIGNLYDRLGLWWQTGYPLEWQSGVRDWILFRIEGVPFLDPWPNFNIADSLLVIGACMLMYQSFFPAKEAE
ncbi:MAG: signal peptidase II [Planctomycetota bacterium]|nr:signal peptidase II [Planctomycetota bacterium]